MAEPVTLTLLTGEADEMRALQTVLEAAPGHAQRVTGLPVGAADAQSTFTALPEGKPYDDKFVYGVWLGDRMVGCIDVIRDFPQPGTAHIGLFLIAEPWQGRGIGRAACGALESEIVGWRRCTQVRLGVVETNDAVTGFWRKLGFAATGEVKPWRYGAVASRVVIFSKALASIEAG